ncbi:LPS translocon maturation chaperone LptM [Nitrosomonas cryotolerans]|nr:lipoprotein [Nitrosomonas cryotolerans]
MFCTVFLLILLLSACGLKAPLYLPQDNALSHVSQDPKEN